MKHIFLCPNLRNWIWWVKVLEYLEIRVSKSGGVNWLRKFKMKNLYNYFIYKNIYEYDIVIICSILVKGNKEKKNFLILITENKL